MKTLSFKTSAFESAVIDRITDRAVMLTKKHGITYDTQTAMMDLIACHCNGCPLDLSRLEHAPEADFAHDVLGIRRHIDRSTGELRDCFLPRTALLDTPRY